MLAYVRQFGLLKRSQLNSNSNWRLFTLTYSSSTFACLSSSQLSQTLVLAYGNFSLQTLL